MFKAERKLCKKVKRFSPKSYFFPSRSINVSICSRILQIIHNNFVFNAACFLAQQ